MKIEIKHLQKSYLQGKNRIEVLSDVNLDIVEGQIIALLGKSGSGKTTLLSLLSGLEKPDNGSIVIDGVDITKLNENQLCDWRAKNLRIIFQQFHLIPHLTAFENVQLSQDINGSSDYEKSLEWLKIVGLSERANHYPSMLSGGEQQRVAIARALVSEPAFLLADEPTGNLDTETGKKIIEILLDIVKTKKITTIIVTHDEELASKADKTIRLSGGRCLF